MDLESRNFLATQRTYFQPFRTDRRMKLSTNSKIHSTMALDFAKNRLFLLLARYVPNVGPTSLHIWFYGGVFEVGGSNGAISGFAILRNSNGDISAADHPIYSVFCSRMGFSGSADRMALIPV